MDESGKIEIFASLLEQQTRDRPKTLYYEVNSGDTQTVPAQDILSSVAKQIRLLQSEPKSRMSYGNSKKLLKSSLVSVNMLKDIVPPNVPKIDDQNVDAACVGVTQEFETTFDQKHSPDSENHNDAFKRDTLFHIIDISLKEPDPDNILETPIQKEYISPDFESKFDNCQILDKCIEIDNIDPQYQLFIHDSEPEKDILTQNTQKRSPSPVFSVKSSKTKSRPSSPLVYNLDTFEKFEEVASSVVSLDTDKDTALSLINSQILGKELCLATEESPFFEENDRISPIIDLNTDILKIERSLLSESHKTETAMYMNKETILPNTRTKEISKNKCENITELKKENLEDEILFSSDEEDERCSKSYRDLPLTCALGTSFFDEESKVSDKTMYVGFQTASNQSILVRTDSFNKAKHLFDDIDQCARKTISVTELVELQDKNKNILSHCDVNVVNVADSYTKEIFSPESNKSTENFMKNNMNITDEIIKEITTATGNTDPCLKLVANNAMDHKDQLLSQTNAVDHNPQVTPKNYGDIKKETPNDKNSFSSFDNVLSNASQSSVYKNIHDNKVKQNLEDTHKLEEDIFLEFEDEMMFGETYSRSLDKDVINLEPESNNAFKTGSNKAIIISDAALQSSKKILEDVDVNTSISPRSIHCRYKHVGFTMADNKKCNLKDADNEKNMSNFKNSTPNVSNKVNNIKSDEDTSDSDIGSPFHGFERNEEEELLLQDIFQRSQKIFENMGECFCRHQYDECRKSHHPNISENIVKQESHEKDNGSKLVQSLTNEGFKTATNKKVNISERALEKSCREIQDLEKYVRDCPNEPCAKRPKLSRIIMFEGQTNADLKNMQGLVSEVQMPSNKPVQTTQKAKTETRKLVEDLEKEIISADLNTFPEFGGFQTASRRPITVSEKALKRSKKLFQDIDNEKFYHTETCKASDVPSFVGFQTASNKLVKISDKSSEKSRKIFQNIYDNYDDMCMEKNVEDVANVPFKDFNAESNKKMNISKEALENSKKLFQGRFQGITESNQGNNQEFRTASNKKIQVSEEALKRSKKLFQDIGDIPETIERKSEDIPIVQAFQIASNKEVKISKETLEKSKKLFEDIDVITEPHQGKFQGFQTASYKKVQISEEALEKRKKLFEDLGGITEPNQGNIQGFQTASNKKVEISKEALKRSKKLFQDIDRAPEIEGREFDTIPKFQGFHTASNKKVQTSEEALEKSKRLFQDIDGIAEPNQRKIGDISKFQGFQTASNNKVTISDQALEKSRKIFQDLDCSEQRKLDYDIPKFNGFQTASNREVKISEESLEKSKKLFQDIDVHDFPKSSRNKGGLQTAITTEVKDESRSAQTNIIVEVKPKTGNTHKIDMCQAALSKYNAFYGDKISPSKKESKFEKPVNIEAFEINTEVLNDFETTFKEISPKKELTPKKSKRSGSPILSCPKAKKRKVFVIPYSQKTERKESVEEPECRPADSDAESKNKFKFSLEYKKCRKYTLKDLQTIEAATNDSDTSIDPYIYYFDFENLLKFEFSGKRDDITDSILTIPDLKNLFQNSTNKKLIPQGWLDIQLKLIIWKLISYEIKFPKSMRFTCTARNVMDQVKFRYDKELYNAERPILRKIMEKDDVSTRTMVLCVVAICMEGDSSTPVLTVTDGWYTIKAIIDKMLSKYVTSRKIKVGIKLLTHGAELVGSEQAVSPWEDTSSIRLKLFGNSTRRARWDARLGCHGNGAILSRLSNVTVEGGKVPKIRVLVTRVYPPLYVDKFEDGSTVTRSERLEHLHQMKFEAERQALLDRIYEEVEREVDQDSEDSECSGCSNRKKKNTGSEFSEIMKRGMDTTQFLSQFTTTQKERLVEYNEKKRERIMAAIQCKVQDKMASCGANVNRNVVTVLKVRVVDIEDRRGDVKVTKATLSIWRPNEAITEVIKENAWIEILKVAPTAFRYSELQLSAGRQSIFSQSKYKESEKIKPYTLALKRTCYPIKNLVNNPTKPTDYNEIDTVGIVFLTEPNTKDFDPSKEHFQNVYITDIDKNLISINFWGGLRKFGFENCLDKGEIVAGINLQKRAGNTRKMIPQYRVTEYSYFTKTPRNDNARKMVEELSFSLSKINKTEFLQECVRVKESYCNKLQGSDIISPYRFLNMDLNSSKTKMLLNTPLAQRRNVVDDNLHLTGLDFESTFKQEDTQEFSPKTLLRKRQLEQKMAKLKMYGEPPALSPIQMINKSKNAAKAYRSPLISKSDISTSVANKEEILPNQENTSKQEECDKIDCSPVIYLNRTYVKKSEPKPVKLNFSKNDESCNDDFAEEFDCSPPLSLD